MRKYHPLDTKHDPLVMAHLFASVERLEVVKMKSFEAGGSYEISSGTRGDFYSDDAGGFTGQ